MWADNHPTEAALLMGYEVVEDDFVAATKIEEEKPVEEKKKPLSEWTLGEVKAECRKHQENAMAAPPTTMSNGPAPRQSGALTSSPQTTPPVRTTAQPPHEVTDMLTITIQVDAPLGQAVGVKEALAMYLERFVDAKVVSVTETAPQQLRLETIQ